jgi:hypothetical protein
LFTDGDVVSVVRGSVLSVLTNPAADIDQETLVAQAEERAETVVAELRTIRGNGSANGKG